MRNALLVLIAGCGTLCAQVARSTPIPIKVVVVTMFERGADTGDMPGEFQLWVEREHLDQVLLTFALILLFEEARSALLDNQFHSVVVPAVLDFSVHVTGDFAYSAYRIAVLGVCLGIAALMFIGIERTRIGSAIRAAAHSPPASSSRPGVSS